MSFPLLLYFLTLVFPSRTVYQLRSGFNWKTWNLFSHNKPFTFFLIGIGISHYLEINVSERTFFIFLQNYYPASENKWRIQRRIKWNLGGPCRNLLTLENGVEEEINANKRNCKKLDLIIPNWVHLPLAKVLCFLLDLAMASLGQSVWSKPITSLQIYQHQTWAITM